MVGHWRRSKPDTRDESVAYDSGSMAAGPRLGGPPCTSSIRCASAPSASSIIWSRAAHVGMNEAVVLVGSNAASKSYRGVATTWRSLRRPSSGNGTTSSPHRCSRHGPTGVFATSGIYREAQGLDIRDVSIVERLRQRETVAELPLSASP